MKNALRTSTARARAAALMRALLRVPGTKTNVARCRWMAGHARNPRSSVWPFHMAVVIAGLAAAAVASLASASLVGDDLGGCGWSRCVNCEPIPPAPAARPGRLHQSSDLSTSLNLGVSLGGA